MDQGLAILREIDDPLELADALRMRGDLELEEGKLDAARAALAEAEETIASAGAGSRPSLERDIAELRAKLAKADEKCGRGSAE